MTGNDILNDVRARLADNEDLAYSESDILLFLNDGERDFAHSGCCQRLSAGQVPTAGVIDLTVLGSVLEIMRVDLDSTRLPLPFAPLNDLNARRQPSLGTPESWTVWGDNLYLDTATTAPCSLWYTFIPTPKTGLSESLDVPQAYQGALAAYVEYRCRKQNDDPLAAQAEAEYTQAKATAAQLSRARFYGGTR